MDLLFFPAFLVVLDAGEIIQYGILTKIEGGVVTPLSVDVLGMKVELRLSGGGEGPVAPPRLDDVTETL